MDVDETSLLTPSDDHVGNKSLTAIFCSHDPPLPGHASWQCLRDICYMWRGAGPATNWPACRSYYDLMLVFGGSGSQPIRKLYHIFSTNCYTQEPRRVTEMLHGDSRQSFYFLKGLRVLWFTYVYILYIDVIFTISLWGRIVVIGSVSGWVCGSSLQSWLSPILRKYKRREGRWHNIFTTSHDCLTHRLIAIQTLMTIDQSGKATWTPFWEMIFPPTWLGRPTS